MGQRSSSVSCGWNRIADTLADPFGVPNINTAAMRTAITLVDTRCASATGSTNEKTRTRRASSFVWRSGTGLAYILQAANARARASLRAPPEAAQAASSSPQSRVRKRAQPETQMKKPARGGLFHSFGGADGTRLHPAGRGCACMRIPSSPAGSRAGGFLHSAVTRPQAGATGNANEKARTRRAFSFVWRSGRDSNPRPPA